MKKINFIFLILPLSVFSATGAIADAKTGTSGTTGSSEGAKIENHQKGHGIIMLEEAIETRSLQISLKESTGTGFVIGRTCDQCDKIQVQITPETRAFSGNTEVPLASAKDRLGRYATVFFDKDKKTVTRIKW
jgi:hypothetical protein